MSSKLDQSLDSIMGERQGAARPRGGKAGVRPAPRRAATRAKTAIAAPAGGIQKNTRAPKTAPTGPAGTGPASGDSKIIVSNLPQDVTETLIKDFFSKAVGHVKKALLSYGPNGRSRGEASIIFSKPDSAAKAQKEFNNVGVDGKPMRIEIVGAAATSRAPAKNLADRMAKPKSAVKENQKSVTAKKGTPKAATNGAAAGGRGGKKAAGRAGRPKAKTADELDAEMADYFGGEAPNGAATNGDAAVNGAAQPAVATNGGDGGEDVVM
ncbi:hypothetical protein LTR36_003854 [Oleoguttula mirabilis]|uniref:RRM domain-containing protein n=1 Tax=Oleoguttula mirabilis TaxID=1507867 RepID=A0AAV9JIB1_9PEZI|nr:hypothetical protein LTR36_003854 [Oleoguttula mirabilis]